MQSSISASALQMKEVSVYAHDSAGESRARLEGISLGIQPGEWLNIVGTNGSGKSTLAKLLAGLTDEGLFGEYARGFAGERPAPYVMQQPDSQLFGSTPREEIIFALEWQGVEASRIGGQAAERLENLGLLSVADEPWERLSGGQRQLAAVAAAAAGVSPLLILDEATSMLDDNGRRRVREAAMQLHASGTAVIWVTQRLDELTPDERVIAMADGRIIFDGPGRSFLYGPDEQQPDLQASFCVRCGLRLPYLAVLALELHRLGKLKAPLPMTPAEWRKIG